MRPVVAIHRRAACARADQSGFTIVEAVVAGLLLLIGSLAVLQTLDAGGRTVYRAEESQTVNNRLQAELERIKALPYAEIALTSTPAPSGDADDPRWRVSGDRYALGRDGTALRQLVANGTEAPGGEPVTGGAVDPGPTPFEVGDVSGRIYRFVAWTSDPNCPSCGGGVMKRVIVAAKIDEAPISLERSFQELHTDVVDPEITSDANPIPPDETDTATAQFWLTDTPCSFSARQAITDHHAAHNTRGICSQGLKTGDERGAPDTMFTSPPVLESDEQPLFDYATDSEPTTGFNEDVGLALPWASNDSCLLSPVLNTLDVKRLLDGVLAALSLPALPGPLDGILDITSGDANKHLRVHSWVSPPTGGSGGVLLGKGTLDLYTKTVNGETHRGEICAWLSVRQYVTIPLLPICLPLLGCTNLGETTIEVDLPMINVGLLSDGECRIGLGLNLTHFTYAQNPWPSEWTKISLPMCFAAVNAAGAVVPAVLPPNSRVALSIMVKKSGTEPGDGLEFMYDAVGYESKLELETNKLLAF